MLSKVLEESLISQAAKLVDKSEKVVILCHERPDGDAIGSSLGLCHLLSELGKDVTMVFPNAVPSFLEWLPGVDEAVVYEQTKEFAEEIIAAADLIFCLDLNQVRRLGEGLDDAFLRSEAKRIMIDHHPEPERFCDIMFSHPELSSTGEMVFRFICRTGHFTDIGTDCATALYTAMVLDTGNFAHNADSADLYDIVAQLIQRGVRNSYVYERLFQNHSSERLKLWGYALYKKMRILPERELAYLSLSNAELMSFSNERGMTEGLVNELLNIEGVRYSVLLREEDTGKINLSFRSIGDNPINQYAKHCFNGGGHANASGGRFAGTIEEAEKHLVDTFLVNESGKMIIENRS